ncbi:hypothetical protein B0J17DRAFT_721382 [Rhizoctonia solani]|nr:hypothetical protein B0J17DRAFT_721382 [Rhizoctonia solani]
MTNDCTSHHSSMQIDIPDLPTPSKRQGSSTEPPKPPSTRKARRHGDTKSKNVLSAPLPAPESVASPCPFIHNSAACTCTVACVQDTLHRFSDPSIWSNAASWGDLANSLTSAILAPVESSVQEGHLDSSALQPVCVPFDNTIRSINFIVPNPEPTPSEPRSNCISSDKSIAPAIHGILRSLNSRIYQPENDEIQSPSCRAKPSFMISIASLVMVSSKSYANAVLSKSTSGSESTPRDTEKSPVNLTRTQFTPQPHNNAFRGLLWRWSDPKRFIALQRNEFPGQ